MERVEKLNQKFTKPPEQTSVVDYNNHFGQQLITLQQANQIWNDKNGDSISLMKALRLTADERKRGNPLLTGQQLEEFKKKASNIITGIGIEPRVAIGYLGWVPKTDPELLIQINKNHHNKTEKEYGVSIEKLKSIALTYPTRPDIQKLIFQTTNNFELKTTQIKYLLGKLQEKPLQTINSDTISQLIVNSFNLSTRQKSETVSEPKKITYETIYPNDPEYIKGIKLKINQLIAEKQIQNCWQNNSIFSNEDILFFKEIWLGGKTITEAGEKYGLSETKSNFWFIEIIEMKNNLQKHPNQEYQNHINLINSQCQKTIIPPQPDQLNPDKTIEKLTSTLQLLEKSKLFEKNWFKLPQYHLSLEEQIIFRDFYERNIHLSEINISRKIKNGYYQTKETVVISDQEKETFFLSAINKRSIRFSHYLKK
ncbi:MAG: hypothetical protein PHX34_03010 [Candidatus Shapirobacteria bacterium]|nr:hypothetical protein [Candidatus Shapirobacteria bacterium]